jgi:chemotaxis protein methyltransferase CheR
MLLRSRLQKRLRLHHHSSFKQYYNYIKAQGESGDELRELINCVTTNKTDFFREHHHFNFIQQQVLPELIVSARSGKAPSRLRIWHAGCSTGEEPYSNAMVIRETLGGAINNWDVRLLATDIDTKVIEHAVTGIYDQERIDQVPLKYRKSSFLAGKGVHSGLFRVKPELQDLITFKQINLLAPAWPIHPDVRFDVIFCRNVVIYFDKPTQRTLFGRFHTLLKPGGYLIIGHSESLLGISQDFDSLGNTIYQSPTASNIRSQKAA